MKIEAILDQIDLGAMALPAFQRGYVWNRDQVRGLMDSLYRKHPVGGLLMWTTKTESAATRGDGQLTPGSVKLLLDGQQRVTSLYGIIRGRPPRFFEGNAQAFTGLYFNVDDERFEFYGPVKMKDDPRWINVTELMQRGLGGIVLQINANPALQSRFADYITRLNAIDTIKQIELHIEEVTGEDKTVDVVVDIFNRVNSGGTKLSKGDLALARICAEWPEARDEMNHRLEKWRRSGFHFRLEWLLRNINAILTGEALFSALAKVEPEQFRDGLMRAERAIDMTLNMIAGRLGLDDSWVLGGPGAIPLMTRYLVSRGGHLADHRERDKLLYWYVHSFLWGRYAGASETVLNQDLEAIEQTEGGLDRLILLLRRSRGDLRLSADDFLGWSRSARFYPLLYMLTRTSHSLDWGTGVELSHHLLGYMNRLELHHIFPKSLLYDHGYARPDVNAIANFTFLTKDTNLLVSNRDPSEYLPEYAAKHPGALESHWIPMDPALWRVERYFDFLAERRRLLAEAANRFLEGLVAGQMPEQPTGPSVLDRALGAAPGGHAGEDEERAIQECNAWVVSQGLPEGEQLYELRDRETDEPIAILDLAWPAGMQEGLSQPVALLVDEDREVEDAANRMGYRYFTDIEVFKEYVRREVLAEEPSAA